MDGTLATLFLISLIVIDDFITGKTLAKYLPLFIGTISAVTVKLIYESRTTKITFGRILASLMGAMSFAYIYGSAIEENCPEWAKIPVMATIIWNGDKIFLWFYDKLDIGLVLSAGFEFVIEKLGLTSIVEKIRNKIKK